MSFCSVRRIHSKSNHNVTSPLQEFLKYQENKSLLATGIGYKQKPTNLNTTGTLESVKFRQACRSGNFTGNSSGYAPGYVQANFVALPKTNAFDFLSFCLRNPKSCPLLAITDPGIPLVETVANGADVRSDIPKYRIFRNGMLMEEVNNICNEWDTQGDMVGFLLGCSFTWENELEAHNLTPRNIEENKNVSMYKTSIKNVPSGPFGGNLVVSMRPYKKSAVQKVMEITQRYPGAHGAPVHFGDPQLLGLPPMEEFRTCKPDFGDMVTINEDEIPLFWACGVTPQLAIIASKVPLACTHSPGCMFITDLVDNDLLVE